MEKIRRGKGNIKNWLLGGVLWKWFYVYGGKEVRYFQVNEWCPWSLLPNTQPLPHRAENPAACGSRKRPWVWQKVYNSHLLPFLGSLLLWVGFLFLNRDMETMLPKMSHANSIEEKPGNGWGVKPGRETRKRNPETVGGGEERNPEAAGEGKLLF